jgi:hypothetical protein
MRRQARPHRRHGQRGAEEGAEAETGGQAPGQEDKQSKNKRVDARAAFVKKVERVDETGEEGGDAEEEVIVAELKMFVAKTRMWKTVALTRNVAMKK